MNNSDDLWKTALRQYHRGRLKKSRHVLNKLLKNNCENGNAQFLAGVVAGHQYDWSASSKHLQQAVKLIPENHEAWFALGNSLRALGQAEEAIPVYEQSLNRQPSAAAYNNMGIAYEDMGHLSTAIKHYQTALMMEPGFVPALYARAPLLGRLRKTTQANQAFTELIKKFPEDMVVRLDYAEFLEQSNRIEESEEVRPDSQQLNNKSDYARCESLRAKILMRADQFDNAFNCLATAHKKTGCDFLLYRLGNLYHRQGYFSAAIRAYDKANSARRNQWNFKRLSHQPLFEFLDFKIQSGFDSMHNSENNAYNICFLTGLPRSGTTLLDRMLDAHPGIQVLEELEGLRTAESALAKGATNEEARTSYIDFIEEHVNLDKTRLIVDKHPFHAMHLDVINKLFPEARIIFSLRHPFDAAFSCYIQDFDPGPVTSKFLALDTTAKLCQLFLTLLTRFENKHGDRMCRVRYENLVVDSISEIKKLLSFLEIDWHDDINRYTQKALHSDPIMTASYDQVIQPVYKTSVNRWRHYSKWLGVFQKYLGNISNELGYDTTCTGTQETAD